ncbi:uncharacterized protein RJT20DRAFT_147587 [Scheffersomyces xylosifermentans]|uniref:uncharacterized protein n=1 Tax=Scheffersomyces xylosifermentans TaxID=1304137 RepID=UPI00315DBC12
MTMGKSLIRNNMYSFSIIFLIGCSLSRVVNGLTVSESEVYRGITFSAPLTVNSGATVRFVDSPIQFHDTVNIQSGASFYTHYTSPPGLFGFFEGAITNSGRFVVDGLNKVISFSPGANNGGLTNSGSMLFGLGSSVSLPLKNAINYGSIYVASNDDSASFTVPYGSLRMNPGASLCLQNTVYRMGISNFEMPGTGGCVSLMGFARIDGGIGGIDSRITVVMSADSGIILKTGNQTPMTVSNFGQGNILGSYYQIKSWGYDPTSGVLSIVNSLNSFSRFNIGLGYDTNQFLISTYSLSGSQPSNIVIYTGAAPNGKLTCNCDTNFGSYNPFAEYITTVSDADSTYSADVLITTSPNAVWYTTTSIIPAPAAESSTTSTAPSSIESSTQIVESSTEPSFASSTQSSSFEPSPSETPSEISPTESSILSSSESVVESSTESSSLDSSVSESSSESSAESSSEISTDTSTDTSTESSIVEDSPSDSSICIQVTVTAEAVTVTVPNPSLPVDTISSLESTTITTTVNA